MKKIFTTTLCGIALAIGGSAAKAQTYNFTIDASQSKVAATTTFSMATTGYLIGQYDATNNPNGTRTKNGLTGQFPSTTNEKVTCNPTLAVGGSINTNTSGAFKLAVDLSKMKVTLTGFNADYLTSGPVTQSATLTLNNNAFRTANPTYSYPSGKMSIPLGDMTIETLKVNQKAGSSVSSTLTKTATNTYTFSVATTATLTTSFTFLGMPAGPISVPVPIGLKGTIILNGSSAQVSASYTINQVKSVNTSYMIPEFAVDLPAGKSKASVWVGMTISKLSTNVQGTYSIMATGKQ